MSDMQGCTARRLTIPAHKLVIESLQVNDPWFIIILGLRQLYEYLYPLRASQKPEDPSNIGKVNNFYVLGRKSRKRYYRLSWSVNQSGIKTPT